MKLTNTQLRRIIKEELGNVMNEMGGEQAFVAQPVWTDALAVKLDTIHELAVATNSTVPISDLIAKNISLEDLQTLDNDFNKIEIQGDQVMYIDNTQY